MNIIRPEGTQLSHEEKLRHISAGIEGSIVQTTHAIAQHLYQVRLIKMSEFDEDNPDELAKKIMGDALRLAIKSLQYLDSQTPRIESAAKDLARSVLKRSPGMFDA